MIHGVVFILSRLTFSLYNEDSELWIPFFEPVSRGQSCNSSTNNNGVVILRDHAGIALLLHVFWSCWWTGRYLWAKSCLLLPSSIIRKSFISSCDLFWAT